VGDGRSTPSPTSSPPASAWNTTQYSIGYIAGWADADVELIRSTATCVLAAVHTFSDAFSGQPSGSVDQRDIPVDGGR